MASLRIDRDSEQDFAKSRTLFLHLQKEATFVTVMLRTKVRVSFHLKTHSNLYTVLLGTQMSTLKN